LVVSPPCRDVVAKSEYYFSATISYHCSNGSDDASRSIIATAYSKPGNLTGSAPSGTPIIVWGLQPGQSYTFIVVATTSNGVTSPSSDSNSVEVLATTSNGATSPSNDFKSADLLDMRYFVPILVGLTLACQGLFRLQWRSQAPRKVYARQPAGELYVIVSFTPIKRPMKRRCWKVTQYTVTTTPPTLSHVCRESSLRISKGLQFGTKYVFHVVAHHPIGGLSQAASSQPLVRACISLCRSSRLTSFCACFPKLICWR
jgi:hypothetical protein